MQEVLDRDEVVAARVGKGVKALVRYNNEGQTPFHKLGTKIDNSMTLEEMKNAAGLNWELIKLPASVEYQSKGVPIIERKRVKQPDGRRLTQDVIVGYEDTGEIEKIMTGANAYIRSTDHRVMIPNAPVGWKEFQNHQGFDFFQKFCDKGRLNMECAGMSADGKRVWILAKTTSAFNLFKGDIVNQFIMLTIPHEYGFAIDMRDIPNRDICSNTLNLSLTDKDNSLKLKINHRKEFDPEAVSKTLHIAQGNFESYKKMAEMLGSRRATRADTVAYLNEVLKSAPSASKKEDKPEFAGRLAKTAFEILETQPGAEFAKGSWWQPFNAVTYMFDHLVGESDESRLYQANYGYNKNRKITALDRALEFAEKSAVLNH